MKVLRKLPRSRKPPKPTTAQQRKSRLARAERENSRPRAETVTVTDNCCTTQGILWMDQGTPCKHDCHYSDHSWRGSTAAEAEPDGPIEPAPVRKDQMLLETACGNCGAVFANPSLAAEHVAKEKPLKLPETEVWDWPEAYADGQSWGQYVKRGPARRKAQAAA